ncbi:hypothetical protein [Staphylococcus pseudintermedius]|uniref:hypothetical protein n=1 Tax=Staphylococcus pseudintermedius TaxID=283734 RepID=UPI002928FCB2|nr:hypothetical protein [Staphylococcus pseudintermedius]EJY6951364.1 hypothetical protein [Staphylococcus pseudintermedius]EJY6953686.1 hypothetical protein [Staphylococcus pseudintermedius]EKF8765123.1 hypothetical protein [Staphylococcus pseudintermedius]MCE5411488.1 hypothetical protein [Staphylococcus pseudintermedius]MCE5447522.1 hypothetical protein [Staphylococcus pseudintermedius]
MKLKKSFGTFLASAILLTTVSPIASATFETQKTVSNSSVEIEKENKALDELFRNPEYVTEQTINNLPTNLKEGTSERIGGSFAVKKGIKAMIKNKKAVFSGVKKISPRAGKSLEKRWDKYVEPALNKILKQEQATWGNVEGQVAQALMGTGIKDSSARSIAYWVSQVGQTLI